MMEECTLVEKKQGIIIQHLKCSQNALIFLENIPMEYHWRGSPLRGRHALAETGHGMYAPGQSKIPSLVTLMIKDQPHPTSSDTILNAVIPYSW